MESEYKRKILKNRVTNEEAFQVGLACGGEIKILIEPITSVNDSKRKLLGIVTNRDLRFENNKSRPIKEVMTVKNLITVNKGTSLKDAEEILQKHKIEKLPVVDKNNKLVGMITNDDVLTVLSCL